MTRWNKRCSEARETDRRLNRSSFVLLSILIVALLAVGAVLHVGTAWANTTMWSARMTVGFNDTLDVPLLVGYFNFPESPYGDYWEDMGSLDPPSFMHEGVEYTVSGIYNADLNTGIYYPICDRGSQCLYLHVDRSLPEGFTLQAGDVQYHLRDADEEHLGGAVYAWQLEATPGWAVGDEVQVHLLAPQPDSEGPGS